MEAEARLPMVLRFRCHCYLPLIWHNKHYMTPWSSIHGQQGLIDANCICLRFIDTWAHRHRHPVDSCLQARWPLPNRPGISREILLGFPWTVPGQNPSFSQVPGPPGTWEKLGWYWNMPRPGISRDFPGLQKNLGQPGISRDYLGLKKSQVVPGSPR